MKQKLGIIFGMNMQLINEEISKADLCQNDSAGNEQEF